MLHGTIRNDDFQRNTALQCRNNVVTIQNNAATMLQCCVEFKIIVANRLMQHRLKGCWNNVASVQNNVVAMLFRVLLSCANQGFCYLNLIWITKFKYERKNEKNSCRSSKMTPACYSPQFSEVKLFTFHSPGQAIKRVMERGIRKILTFVIR